MLETGLNPLEKLIFTAIGLIGIHSAANPIINGSYMLFFIILIIGSGISTKKILGTLGGALFFIVPSFAAQGRMLDWTFFLTVMASLASIYFFLLTTEVKEFYHLARFLKLPGLFCELGIMMFGYLNQMLKSYHEVKIAMMARGGFASFKTVYRDTGLLFSGIFKKLYFSLNSKTNAMYSRCYEDSIRFFPVNYKITVRGVLLLILWAGMNVVVRVVI